jgi:hypothetical protein
MASLAWTRWFHRGFEGPVIAFIDHDNARCVGEIRALVDPRPRVFRSARMLAERLSFGMRPFRPQPSHKVDHQGFSAFSGNESEAKFATGKDDALVVEAECGFLSFIAVALAAALGEDRLHVFHEVDLAIRGRGATSRVSSGSSAHLFRGRRANDEAFGILRTGIDPRAE